MSACTCCAKCIQVSRSAITTLHCSCFLFNYLPLHFTERVSGPGRVCSEGPGTLLRKHHHSNTTLLGLSVPGKGQVCPSKSRKLCLPPPPTPITSGGEGDGKGNRFRNISAFICAEYMKPCLGIVFS